MKDTVMSMRPHDGDSALLTPSAVLLLNLGTPDAPTPSAVRRYLREFLSDKRVVELPRALWWVILNGVVLPLRATKVAKKYASIWLHSGIQNLLDSESLAPFQPNAAALSGSPLRVYSQAQADTLQKYFEQQGRTIKVRCVMRYGNPALADALDALLKEGVERVLLLPLYPQYSATTTASAYDAVFNYLMRLRNQPAIRTVKDYCDHPAYIEALRCHIEGYWQIHGRPHFLSGEKLLLSFHGLPQRCIDLGDPYYEQCLRTVQSLRQALQLNAEQAMVSFQSRFGKERWLEPYTTTILQQLGKDKRSRVDVFCPGFPADCLETLEEIAMEGGDTFRESGGGTYHAIPCLNHTPAWIAALAQIVQENL